MLVTRVGYGSKLVLAGDTRQSDIGADTTKKEGLMHLIQILKDV